MNEDSSEYWGWRIYAFGAKPWSELMLHIVVQTIRNTFHWKFIWNSEISIQENAFENVVWKWGAICLSLNVISRYIV